MAVQHLTWLCTRQKKKITHESHSVGNLVDHNLDEADFVATLEHVLAVLFPLCLDLRLLESLLRVDTKCIEDRLDRVEVCVLESLLLLDGALRRLVGVTVGRVCWPR